MRRFSLIVALAAAMVLPTGAFAQQTNSPPGNSGISQYLEVVPSTTGNKSSRGDGTKKTSPLSEKQQSDLASQGSDGKALSEVVANTSPQAQEPAPVAKPKATKKKKKTTKTTTTTTTTPAQDEQTVTTENASAVAAAYDSGSGGSGGSGIGVPLVALMAVAAVAVGIIALARHRSGGAPVEAEPEL